MKQGRKWAGYTKEATVDSYDQNPLNKLYAKFNKSIKSITFQKSDIKDYVPGMETVAQQYKFTACTDNLGSVSKTHVVAHNCL